MPTPIFKRSIFLLPFARPDPALIVWRRFIALGKPFGLQRTFPLFDELIVDDRSSDAARVWVEALTAAGLPHDPPLKHSLIWNGDFAHDFENGGLGWRWNTPSGRRDRFRHRSPFRRASARCGWISAGAAIWKLPSRCNMLPSSRAETIIFTHTCETEGITTESGMRFSITDPNHNAAVSLLTENLTGSHQWTAVDLDLTTGPETHFLLVQLFRTASRMFENKLSGTVWLADVTLVPAESEPGNAPQ